MGYIVISGSSNEKYIAENHNVFDFELSEDEMQEIKNIDKNERFADY